MTDRTKHYRLRHANIGELLMLFGLLAFSTVAVMSVLRPGAIPLFLGLPGFAIAALGWWLENHD